MTPEQWKQVEGLFAEANELPTAERSAFLDRCCSDPAVRREVESLLGYAAEEGHQLHTIVDGVAALLPQERPARPADRNLIGRTLGPYRITRLIGRGGMGEIYAADDPRLGRQIALKLLPSMDAEDAYRLKRFQREARAASALNHPNIVTIYEFGEAEGIHYIATEFVQGWTIRQILLQEAPPVREVVAIAVQIAGALAAAHTARIVHRDIKPENVMVRPDGYVKVLDFGLAKLRERETSTHASLMRTGPGVIMGTVRYMSPEQARGLETDARTDLFSLGVVLYEMLSGNPPFTGETPSDVLASILRSEPPPLSRLASVPRALETIVQKCLLKDRDERYLSAHELLIDLQALQRELDSSERLAVRTVETGLQTAAVTSAPSLAPPPAETLPHRRRFLIWSAAAAATGGLAAAGFLILRRTPPISPGNLRITTFATNSNILDAVISPDGRHAAYSMSTRGLCTLWVKQLLPGTNEIPLVPPSPITIQKLSYSPDGAYLYYMLVQGREYGLQRQLSLGGVPLKVLENVVSPAAFSPGGDQMACIRRRRHESAELVISKPDGSSAWVLATSNDDFAFSSFQWAEDGKSIRYEAGRRTANGTETYLAEIPLNHGPQKILLPASHLSMSASRWIDRHALFSILPDPDAGHQIWHVSLPGGVRTRLTHDSNDYRSLSLSADGGTILALHRNDAFNIFVADLAVSSSAPQQITSGLGAYWCVSWAARERIVFVLKTGGKSDLWIMPKEGEPRQQLTVSGDLYPIEPALSRDERFIAFSARNGLWLLELEGSRLRQLHANPAVAGVTFSPDGRWIHYYIATKPEEGAWKIPLEGGSPVRFGNMDNEFQFSQDGQFLAFVRAETGQADVVVEIRPADGSHAVRTIPVHFPGGVLVEWMDRESVIFSVKGGSAPGIYRLSLKDGRSVPLLVIEDGNLNGVSISADGRRAAYLAGGRLATMVTLQNFL